MHRREDDLHFADRASKGMVVEIQFDGAHRGIVSRNRSSGAYKRRSANSVDLEYPARLTTYVMDEAAPTCPKGKTAGFCDADEVMARQLLSR